jgi:hypothetical protein
MKGLTLIIMLILVLWMNPAKAKLAGPHPEAPVILNIIHQRLGSNWVGNSGNLLGPRECKVTVAQNAHILGSKNPEVVSESEQRISAAFWQWLSSCVKDLVTRRLNAPEADLTKALGSSFTTWLQTSGTMYANAKWSQLNNQLKVNLATHLSHKILDAHVLNEAKLNPEEFLLTKIQALSTNNTSVTEAVSWMSLILLSHDLSVME